MKKNPESKKSSIKKDTSRWIYPGILIVVSLITWWSTGKLDFVNWDDVSYLTSNPDVQNFSWKKLLTEFYAGNYHPLTMVSLAAEHTISGMNPASFHRTNFILHTLNVVLVFYLIRNLFSDRNLALGTAILFSVHPLHVESVAWIAERKDLLYTAFWMLSAIFWISFLKTNQLKWAGISVLFFILSCLSKAMAVTLVPFLFLMEYLVLEKPDYRKQIYKLPFILIALATGILALYAQGDALKLNEHISVFDRLLLVNYGYWFYVFRTFLPVSLSAFYPYPVNIPLWMYVLPVLTLAAVYILYLKKGFSKIILFGILSYVLILFPVSQIIPVGEAITADRYSYLSSLGLFLAMTAMVLLIAEKHPVLKKSLPIVLILVSVALILTTRDRIQVWKNSISLYENILVQFPRYSTGYVNYGNALRDNRDWNGAERAYMMAIYADPKNDLPWNNLGILASFRNQTLRSVYFYGEAAKRKPGFPVNDYNIATAWFNIGRIDQALPAVEKSLSIDPEYPEALHLHGVILQQLKRYPEAVSEIQKALSYYPEHLQMLTDLGNTYFFQGNTTEAERWFRKSISIKPEQNPDAYNNLAYVLFQTGRQTEAIEMYRKAASQGHTAAQEYLKQIGQ